MLRVRVQVVRRLVEHQQVAPAEQDARELEAAPLTARERPDRQRQAVVRQAEAGGERARLGLRRVAAELAVLLLQTSEPRDVLVRVRLLELDPRLLQAPRQIDQIARGQDVLQPRDVIVGAVLARVLPQVADRARPGRRCR